MDGIHIVMPMAGHGSRFFDEGYMQPKPLLPLFGKPFFYWATESLTKFMPVKSLTFVVLQEHVDNFAIDKEIISFYPESKLVTLPKTPNGAVLTSLEGIKGLPMDEPVIFNDCDHIFTCPLFYLAYISGHCQDIDGALLTFPSHENKYSYCAFDEKGNVARTVEKQVISEDAICGAYYFRSSSLFVEASEKYLDDCAYREFFLSGVYNLLAQENKIIKAFRVSMHRAFGTPEEYRLAQQSQDFEVFSK